MSLLLSYFDGSLNNGSGLARLFLAGFLCGIIGLERESKHKPVGFKTCVIISVASCLLTLISITSALYYSDLLANIRTDPMRLAAQIISGVGFIGAGVILHRSNQIISGLTTAAIIWSSAAIGIACGAGFYFLATTTTFLILLVIKFSNVVTRLGRRLSKHQIIDARVIIVGSETIEPLLDDLREKGYLVDNVNIMDDKKNRVEVTIRLRVKKNSGVFLLYSTLKHLEYVYSVSLSH
ncbi:hypothetical protein Z042_02380 [Chania multitudinisentens RB-25]|uniref:Protein MgtC n=1 Tax=Chania multitudinisentens RB-25 TaxID=1441930 RepID=W0L9B8_9GAMM|nr:MgtC/SapB family protein [Chania multitudinisentens]AHG18595.1 hypothetical protein Z042_02380 [Chania multitudinisentens RB-25]